VLVAVVAMLVPASASAAGPPEPAPAQQPAAAPPVPTLPAAAGPPASEPAEPAYWAQPQIETVVAAGLMGPSVAEFRPDDPLLWGELASAIGVLSGRTPVVADPNRPIKLPQLDAWVVRALGLSRTASLAFRNLSAAGLEPPRRVGIETVARMLGLRVNHEGADEGRELGPGDVATRAEAAYSLAKALEWRGTDLSWLQTQIGGLALPQLTEWQRRVLSRAVRFVGQPYVWGGTFEGRQLLFDVEQPGGFDCSGFVWRVYRLEPFDDAPQLAGTLVGRTTYEMSAERSEAERIPGEALQPGDIVFFGNKGPRSKPSQVGHMGILLSPGWMVHSGGNGVTIAPLEGWYAERLAWGRRPLAEAGLA
jgi:cell wall-associated NlpC family hydrolase